MKWTGETIRNLAKERGLPLTKVAEEIEVSRQTINDWINGQVPKGNHLISLCKILQAKPDDFFSNNSEPLISIPVHRVRKREEYLDGIYDEEEENFCDTIANYIQFPDEYVKYVYDAISGLSKAFQINKLKMFSKEHGHCLYGIVKRIKSLYPDFALNVGGADGNLRKDFQSIGDFLFKSAEPRDYVNKLWQLSPRLVELIIDQLDNITYRKLGELLGLQSILDAKAVKEELSSLRKGNFSL